MRGFNNKRYNGNAYSYALEKPYMEKRLQEACAKLYASSKNVKEKDEGKPASTEGEVTRQKENEFKTKMKVTIGDGKTDRLEKCCRPEKYIASELRSAADMIEAGSGISPELAQELSNLLSRVGREITECPFQSIEDK